MKNKPTFLVTGDTLAIAVVTLIGFVTHGEVGVEFLPRMAATFVPVCASWFALAALTGLLGKNPEHWRDLWRVPVVMALSAPLAVLLRAAWLGGVALPLFALVLAANAALGMLLWRAAAMRL